MALPPIPLPEPAGPVNHPRWCTPEYCQVNELGDVQHCSAPVSYRFTAGDVEVTLQRTQHGDYLGAIPPRSYLATVTHTELHEQATIEMIHEDKAAVRAMFRALDEL